jgi:peptide/nickel transport system permease protein
VPITRFLLRRLLAMIIILLILTAVMFVLQQISDVDPVTALLGHASKAVVARTRRRLGYDQPLIVQYLRYVGDVARGNFQESLHTHRPVASDLGTYLPPTIELVVFALVLSVAGGLLLGIASALRWRGATVLRVVMLSAASAPSFLVALVALVLFYSKLGWLPATGQTSISNAPTGPTGFLLIDALIHGRLDVIGNGFTHLLLPGLCLAIGPMVAIGRVLRSALVVNFATDYVRTAESKGLSRYRVIAYHSLRNCMNGALSMSGLQIGFMFGGVVIVEEIFAWPGVGAYIAQSIQADDFPAIVGVTLVFAAMYVVVNAVVDIVQALADPRIALS